MPVAAAFTPKSRPAVAPEQVVVQLAGKGSLREGLDVGSATDVLLTVLGDGVWHQLRSERGWTPEHVTDWMCDALPRLLLDPADTSD